MKTTSQMSTSKKEDGIKNVEDTAVTNDVHLVYRFSLFKHFKFEGVHLNMMKEIINFQESLKYNLKGGITDGKMP